MCAGCRNTSCTFKCIFMCTQYKGIFHVTLSPVTWTQCNMDYSNTYDYEYKYPRPADDSGGLGIYGTYGHFR